MDAELDLVDNANGLISTDDADAPERNRFAGESDDGDEFDNGPDEESEGLLSLAQFLRLPYQRSQSGPLHPKGAQGVDYDDGESAHSTLPPHLKEISSLAAWTVSSHKPGCGVAALCHSSITQFWQSDGPQPHYLNIHFFKMVAIAHIRVFLDFEQDESYTPTKLQFMAGTGHHDLQDVCIMTFKEPKGWLEVDLSNAGGPNPFEDGDFDDDEQESRKPKKRNRQPGHGPTLRCRLVQLRILENHQNGKDTHLRGLQLFAVDESAIKVRRKRQISVKSAGQAPKSPSEGVVPSGKSDADGEAFVRQQDAMDLTYDEPPEWHIEDPPQSGPKSTAPAVERNRATQSTGPKTKRKKRRSIPMVGLREPEWMGEPTLR